MPTAAETLVAEYEPLGPLGEGADPCAKRIAEAAAEESGAKRRKASKVPVIDVSPFFADGASDAQRRAVAAAVAEACEQVGFFVVTGHGIDQSIPRACAAEAHRFFSLSHEEKSRFAANGEAYGFFPMNSEALGYNADVARRPDIREAFSMGPQDDPPASLERTPVVDFCYQTTPWPPDGHLREVMVRHYEEAGKLANGMLRIFALALRVDAEFFLSKVTHHASSLRAIRYPRLEEEPLPGQLRCGAHSDICTMTILWQDVHGGLEVLPRGDSDWMKVECPEDGFVINLGDLFMRWTNERWLSTPHRVTCPRLDDPVLNVPRISMPYFQILNSDAMIECIESCKQEGEAAKHPPTTQGEDLMSHFKRWGRNAKKA